MHKCGPFIAKPTMGLAFGQRLEVAQERDALDCQLPRQRWSNTGQKPNRLGRQQRGGFTGPHNGKAARLVAFRSDFGEQPILGEPNRHG